MADRLHQVGILWDAKSEEEKEFYKNQAKEKEPLRPAVDSLTGKAKERFIRDQMDEIETIVSRILFCRCI